MIFKWSLQKTDSHFSHRIGCDVRDDRRGTIESSGGFSRKDNPLGSEIKRTASSPSIPTHISPHISIPLPSFTVIPLIPAASPQCLWLTVSGPSPKTKRLNIYAPKTFFRTPPATKTKKTLVPDFYTQFLYRI
jgi:hypothetical protein